MSLKDVITSVTGEPADPEAARRPVLDEIARNREAFAHRRGDAPADAWFSTGEPGMIGFAPRRPDGQPIVVGGQSITFWDEGEFPRVLDAFEAALRDGELDGELTGATPAGSSLPLERLTSRLRRD